MEQFGFHKGVIQMEFDSRETAEKSSVGKYVRLF